jgi:hypothetical protein
VLKVREDGRIVNVHALLATGRPTPQDVTPAAPRCRLPGQVAVEGDAVFRLDGERFGG